MSLSDGPPKQHACRIVRLEITHVPPWNSILLSNGLHKPRPWRWHADLGKSKPKVHTNQTRQPPQPAFLTCRRLRPCHRQTLNLRKALKLSKISSRTIFSRSCRKYTRTDSVRVTAFSITLHLRNQPAARSAGSTLATHSSMTLFRGDPATRTLPRLRADR